jgi:hypothetical protein
MGVSLLCPLCRSPRTADTIDIATGDRDRMCATCGHHWYPAPVHPLLPQCCTRFLQSRLRSTWDGTMLRCPGCRRDLVLRGRWLFHDPAHYTADGWPLPEATRQPRPPSPPAQQLPGACA